MGKLHQFLADEQEVLADFLMDMESTEENKEYARAAALWSMQSARVGAIKDVLTLLGYGLEEEQGEQLLLIEGVRQNVATLPNPYLKGV